MCRSAKRWPRASPARWRDLDGYMTNTADGQRSPQQRDELGRLALRWTPRDELVLDGKLEYSNNTTRGF